MLVQHRTILILECQNPRAIPSAKCDSDRLRVTLRYGYVWKFLAKSLHEHRGLYKSGTAKRVWSLNRAGWYSVRLTYPTIRLALGGSSRRPPQRRINTHPRRTHRYQVDCLIRARDALSSHFAAVGDNGYAECSGSSGVGTHPNRRPRGFDHRPTRLVSSSVPTPSPPARGPRTDAPAS